MTIGARLALVAVLVSAGCGSAAPSASVTPSPSPVLTPSPTMTHLPGPTVTVSPSVSAPVTAMPSDGQEIADLPLQAHRITSEFTGHVSAYVSLGSEIVWSGGRRDTDNNLYRLMPSASQPDLLYENREPDSYLTGIAGSAAGYLFTDERWIDGERRGWRLWFLAAPGEIPLLVDQSTDDRQIAPTIAMNDQWLAWEVVHGTHENPVNELRVASIADPLMPTTLLSYPGRDVYMQFPSLWDDELWYGIADNDWEALTEKPRVEMIELSNPGVTPAVFGAEQRAFMPAPGRDVIAWKSGGSDEFAALNSGLLTIYWRATGQTDELPLPGRETAAERISYPSVGNRFVSWWDDIAQRFYVYDLIERQFRRIAEYDWTGEERMTKPSLSGDLLVYTHHLSDGERYLEWCLLPE